MGLEWTHPRTGRRIVPFGGAKPVVTYDPDTGLWNFEFGIDYQPARWYKGRMNRRAIDIHLDRNVVGALPPDTLVQMWGETPTVYRLVKVISRPVMVFHRYQTYVDIDLGFDNNRWLYHWNLPFTEAREWLELIPKPKPDAA